MTILPNFLMKRAALTPNRIALEMEDRSVTFFELYRNSLNWAGKLVELGVKRGDRISLFMANSLELVELLFALKNIGAITVLHNLRLTSKELFYQVEDAESRFILVDDEREIGLKESKEFMGTQKIVPVSKVFRLEGSDLTVVKEFSLEEIDTIMYTSGTTGFPKGVKQTYGNHFWSATGSALNMGLHEEDCWLLAVPIFHISGLSILMRSVIYGMRVIIHKRFEAEAVHQDLMERQVSIVSVVTTMLSGLLEQLGSESYPPSFRCMLVGGGPVPKSVLEECMRKSIPVYQTYGMTETCSQIVTLSPDFSMSKVGSAGKALFPCQLKIMLDGMEVEPNETGEIVVKGPNVTTGYYNREESTSEAIQDGWLYTGDLGYVDEEGFLFVVDRRSDLIISGGENVYPAEIEAILVSHPSVKDAGVTGMPDHRWGQVPVAFVVSDGEKEFLEEALLSFVREQLAGYKTPKKIYVVERLPRNASNKLMRRELLKMLPGGVGGH
ncbi:o-succinylbenzoate--CoA ligase [Sutcliffiella horikoshii]|uniref:2-succinylbenzoate--CoA ligase n=1 Tax=Sutcliffiella horikoshii TaxID=79883 RepID=A0AA94WND2_9BACI|nr:o-succinylbenzoate--CoA ligase [Sutcliffiella horikoshii]TYS55734.1 o-succinylbenzoate--CoA ligase [Sutcliffiella horikoshii]